MAPAWQVWTALWIVYIVWGSTYLGIRVLVETAPPLLATGARFACAGALIALWLLARGGRAAVSATRGELRAGVLVGTLLVGGTGLVAVAEQRGAPSSYAALIFATIPLWVVLLRRVTVALPPGEAPEAIDALGHHWRELPVDLRGYAASGLPARTMGRSLEEDTVIFAAALAAGTALADAVRDPGDDGRR